MITKELIRKGIESKVIRLEADPHGCNGRGTVCAIGEYWFYFGGETAEELTPDEYQENVPMEEIVDEIFDVLEEFRKTDDFAGEYGYYLSMLFETCAHLSKKTVSVLTVERRMILVKANHLAPGFEMIISIPKERDAEEYIDELLDRILVDELRYSIEWDFVDGLN